MFDDLHEQRPGPSDPGAIATAHALDRARTVEARSLARAGARGARRQGRGAGPRSIPRPTRTCRCSWCPKTQARPNPEHRTLSSRRGDGHGGTRGPCCCSSRAPTSPTCCMARAAGRGREVALRAALGARRGRIVRQFLTESRRAGAAGEPGRRARRGAGDARPRAVHRRGRRRSPLSIRISASICRVLARARWRSPSVRASSPGWRRRCRACPRRSQRVAEERRPRRAGRSRQQAPRRAGRRAGGAVAHAARQRRPVRPQPRSRARHRPGFRSRRPAAGVDGRLACRATIRRSVWRSTETSATGIAALPGVEQAAWISWPPFGSSTRRSTSSPRASRQIRTGGRPERFAAGISPDYFATARVPLVEGRAFDERDDADGAPVAIVNQTLARQFWPGQSAVGRRLTIGKRHARRRGRGARRQVPERLGVAQARWSSGRLRRTSRRSATMAVRTARAPSDMASALRQAIRSVDPDVAVYDVRTDGDHLDTATRSSSSGWARS